MIELKEVTKRYGQAAVLKNINLSIEEPGIYCLLGRNGAGKTTLLKSIAGYQNITEGESRVDGRRIATSTLDTGVSYIENFARHFNLPVRKLLRIASEVNPSYDYDFAIEEIAKTIQKLIIIDKGSICFFDTLQAVEEKACSLQDFFIQMDGHRGGEKNESCLRSRKTPACRQ